MTLWLRSVDGISPVGLTIDILAAHAFDEPGPLWVAIDYWVHTPSTQPGGVSGDMTWEDPVGNTAAFNGTTLDSTDPLSKNANTQVFALERLDSAASPWQLDFTAANPANDGLISYRVEVFKPPATVTW